MGAPDMKQIITLLVLVGLFIWGYVALPAFLNYLTMLGLISFLVIAHELGHFWVAKKVGVKVERFGFGLPFGPTLFEYQCGETTFCLHPVLLGGYVSFPDDNPESSVAVDSPQRFENKPLWARAAIAIAGVTVNAILAYALMLSVATIWGMPSKYFVQVKHLLSDTTPAAIAGVKPGDRFVSLNQKEIASPDDFLSMLEAHKSETVVLTVERANAERLSFNVTPDQKGKIGIAISLFHKYEKPKTWVDSLTQPYFFLQDKVFQNFSAIGQIFSGKRSSRDISGPVGIIKQGGEMIGMFGIAEGLVITAIISIILAVMNVLPIPMLDGGHLLFMLIELITGKPVQKSFQERFVQVGFALLLGLMALVLFNDVNIHILGH
jgi:membrane-associated protease RseP (regulator of RpoE activity)